jgi:hypothetical protein
MLGGASERAGGEAWYGGELGAAELQEVPPLE